MPYTRPFRREEFAVAIICALQLEYDAVSYTFDQFWDENGDPYGRAAGDLNVYTTGRIGAHNVVLTLLSNTGKANAASAAAIIRSSYTEIKLALLIGVCGGVPQAPNHSKDGILLGDVIIGKSVIQYDFGRQYPDKFVRKNDVKDNLRNPVKDIRNLLCYGLVPPNAHYKGISE
ncbi:hypothetical protein ZTR_07085 [Talaromyces verruculosus]|nr:hypothetical protein ZTR_07085 [Talaromyces verruculosus]